MGERVAIGVRHIVSVPYRGATFLNDLKKNMRDLAQVSVPYRGATFLNNIGILLEY